MLSDFAFTLAELDGRAIATTKPDSLDNFDPVLRWRQYAPNAFAIDLPATRRSDSHRLLASASGHVRTLGRLEYQLQSGILARWATRSGNCQKCDAAFDRPLLRESGHANQRSVANDATLRSIG